MNESKEPAPSKKAKKGSSGEELQKKKKQKDEEIDNSLCQDQEGVGQMGELSRLHVPLPFLPFSFLCTLFHIPQLLPSSSIPPV